MTHPHHTYLFGTTTEGDVETYDGLGSIVHVHGLTELGVEQTFLSGEHFEVTGLAVVHQLVGAGIGIIEHLYLTVEVAVFLAGRHAVGHSLVHLIAGIDDRLHVFLLQILLSELSDLVIGIDLATGEDGLCQLSDKAEE